MCFASVRDAYLRRRFPQLAQAFACESHLTLPERVKLYSLARGCGVMAEIGSYLGASACCFGAAAIETGSTKVICIDTWGNDAMTEGCRDTWRAFSENTLLYASSIVPIRGYSSEVLEQVQREADALDLLFVDGDHSYEGVLSDWRSYKRLLRAGSVVIFHDYGWAGGVKRVIREEVAPVVIRSGALPNMWWGILA